MRPSLKMGCLTLALALCSALPAWAGPNLRVLETDFTSQLLQPDGSEVEQSTTMIPLIPDISCFQWTIKVDSTDVLRIKEILKLPAAPESWGEADTNEFSPTVTSADRKTAVTVVFMPAKDGVLTNRWCVAAGDPAGQYSIEVLHEGQSLKTFDFTLTE